MASMYFKLLNIAQRAYYLFKMRIITGKQEGLKAVKCLYCVRSLYLQEMQRVLTVYRLMHFPYSVLAFWHL